MLSSWRGCCARVPQRWIFAIMGCLAIANAFTMLMCMSLAITEMVKSKVTTSNSTVLDETCPSVELTSSSHSTNDGTYEWDEYTQGIILSSFYWGSVVTQIPSGLLAAKFGGKIVLGLGIFFTSIFSILTPIVVQTYDSTGLIILRVSMGLCQGTTLPASSVLISQWAPPNERSKIGTVVTSGAALGTLLGNALTGVLIQYSPIGWSIVFYFFGVGGLLWFFAWIVLCYNNPDEHPFISEKEKKYLKESIHGPTNKQTQPVPWRHILTSVPIWALMAGQFGYLWAFYTLATDLPKYMSSVLKFSIKSNGLLTAIPYILKLVFSNLVSWPADWLIESNIMSRTHVRKAWFSFAMLLPASFIIAASYSGCDSTVVVIFFTIAVVSMGPNYSSLLVNPNDLSPNYSGTIMALGNVLGTVAGILAPYVIGILTPNQTLSEWRIVFWITFVISWSTILIFDIWADGEVQYWNDLEVKVDREEEIGDKVEATVDNVHSMKLSL